MILLIGGLKGGSGKSTVATNLAVWLAQEGRSSILIDADRQRTSSKWFARRNETRETEPNLPRVVVAEQTQDVYNYAIDMEEQYGVVVIDAGGRDNPQLRKAALAADFMYVPVLPSQFDIESLEELAMVLDDVRQLNPKLQARLFLSRAAAGRANDEIADAKAVLSDFPGFALSDGMIGDRKVFRQAALAGKGAVEMNNPQARAEIQLLAQEIFEGG
jgi:chromosome partitioning protein